MLAFERIVFISSVTELVEDVAALLIVDEFAELKTELLCEDILEEVADEDGFSVCKQPDKPKQVTSKKTNKINLIFIIFLPYSMISGISFSKSFVMFLTHFLEAKRQMPRNVLIISSSIIASIT